MPGTAVFLVTGFAYGLTIAALLVPALSEFDFAMGKMSQADFDEMSGRLRARALSLMKQLDLGASGYDATFGSGRLNSYRAVTGATLPAGG
mgnify:CR=1 FL=1